MSGKKDKESRRLAASIDKITKQAHIEIETERKAMTSIVLDEYHEALNRLSLIKRARVAWRILRGKA